MEKLIPPGNELPFFYLALGWVVYFIVHSGLASETAKKFLQKLGLSLKSQRLIYNIISTLGLLFLLLLNGVIGGPTLFERTQFIKIIALFLAGGGVLIINAAFKRYDLKGFLGLKEEPDELNRSGILNYIRHPIYSGSILLLIGFFLFDPRLATLVSVVLTFLYLVIGVFLEEKKLIKTFGQQYLDYKKEVPAVFPNIFKLFKKIT